MITRCNGSTAGGSFHKVKTAEAAFQAFSFVPKIPFNTSLRSANLKLAVNQIYAVRQSLFCQPRTANQIISVKPSYPVRPARKVSTAVLERCRQPCSKGADSRARKVPIPLLEHCRYLHSKPLFTVGNVMPLPCTAG